MKKRVVFIHQNFPAQFVHVARALTAQGHEVVAVAVTGRELPGVRLIKYHPEPLAHASVLRGVSDFETKVIRGLGVLGVLEGLKAQAWRPDLVVVHPGWGEALFVKDVWPDCRMVVFNEFFYRAQQSDVDFDPEFPYNSVRDHCALRLRNSHVLHALSCADGIYTPTHWQRAQLPPEYRGRARVMFDGVDTRLAKPDAAAFVELQRAGLRLTAADEVITFVNRNLEPYRGFHVFMRALPALLRRRPNAQVLIIGGNDVSYGQPPPHGENWRTVMLRELHGQLPMDRIHFVGKVPYKVYLNVLQVSACHVYLTYPFVLSWSCLEAMAAGCVVVGSKTQPVQEVIEHGKTGLLVDFFDRDALVNEVVTVLDNRADYAAMREAARAHVVAHYDLMRVCLPEQLAYLHGFAGMGLTPPAVG